MIDNYKNKFPIKTATACQSKWTWSTVWLNDGLTSSCHRVHSHPIDPDNFSNFHNIPEKIADREKMLQGLWPDEWRGCNYCKEIEEAGGASDRMHFNSIQNLVPIELYKDKTLTHVSPRIVEIFAQNTCNLSCIYCREELSSKIERENKKFGNLFEFEQKEVDRRNIHITKKQKMYEDWFVWLEENIQKLTRLHLLGGETFLQHDLLKRTFDIIKRKPNKFLQLNIFSNFNIPEKYFYGYLEEIKNLAKSGKIGRFDLTCSIDCWGPEQEYVRSGLNLKKLETYFEFAAKQESDWLKLNINQTITCMTIKTMPELIENIKKYNVDRQIGHYFEILDKYDFQNPNIFNFDLWEKDFEVILGLIKGNDYHSEDTYRRMLGIKKLLQANCKQDDLKIKQLHDYLDELDRRRNTNWRPLFPYLIV